VADTFIRPSGFMTVQAVRTGVRRNGGASGDRSLLSSIPGMLIVESDERSGRTSRA
jgi:hypothetical protein